MSAQMKSARQQMEVRSASPTVPTAWAAQAAAHLPTVISILAVHVVHPPHALLCPHRTFAVVVQENEDLSILMSGLRGSNVSEQDFASDGVVMNVVEVDDNDFGDSLPLK